jgi:hypothetical protein
MAAWKPYQGITLAAMVAACALLSWGLFHGLGAIGLVMMAPVWGVVLALPILDGLSAFGHLIRLAAWRDVAGRYYEHRGVWMDVVEDEARQRFVRLEHVRRFLPDLPSDASLRHRYAGLVLERESYAYLQDEALIDYLDKATTPDGVKLQVWLEKNVALPGRNARARR